MIEALQERYKEIKKIVDDKQCRKVDGILLDLFTASAIISVCDGLNETNKEKFLRLSIDKMSSIAWKVLK